MREDCGVNELFIEQFADNELDYQTSAEISAHLKVCGRCRKRYESICRLKSAVRAFAENEKLSFVEKEGFMRLADQTSARKKVSFSQWFKNVFVTRSTALVVSSVFSFACLVLAFVISINNSNKANELIIDELLTAHSYVSPNEFVDDQTARQELASEFSLDKNTLRKIESLNMRMSRKLASIAAVPTAKIKLAGDAGSQERGVDGTLFLSKENERLQRLFENSRCALERNGVCLAKEREENGKKVVYWKNTGNNFVFVSDRGNSENLVRYISSVY
ncbi:zf-HC2 domain-containing protein [bacterium]|nr:zf-HC2 domain-containing protein [bacterium]